MTSGIFDEGEASDTGHNRLDDDEVNLSSNPGSTSNFPMKMHPSVVTKARITKKPLLNARRILSGIELDVLPLKRGLPRRALRETNPEVVARLTAAESALSTSDFDDLFGVYFDKRKGKRFAKIAHLQEYDAAKSLAGSNGNQPTDSDFIESYPGYEGAFGGLTEWPTMETRK